jgi:metal-responsive CopG/Arc/MetJ family transcriptional regulator
MAYGRMRVVEKTTVYLDAHLRAGLQALAKRRGVPQAELIREALRIYLLSERQHRLPSWVGAITDGPVTDSSTIKQELRPLWIDVIERRGSQDQG